ncbi:hypothetical protein NPIL_150361, partial [Nephila pilipes]
MVLMETSNQFDNLSIEEPPDFLIEPENTPSTAARANVRPNVASTTTSNRQATRKERPVPPITIDNIPRKDLLIKQLRDLTSGRITARVQGSGIKMAERSLSFPPAASAHYVTSVWLLRSESSVWPPRRIIRFVCALFFVSFWIVYILYSAYFVILTMDPKVKDKTGEKKKPKKMISMEAKHEIIAKHERGVRIIDLANEYGRNPSTISTIIKQKEAIK